MPHASDSAITFPDVTTKTQGAKLIDTCVLYIDIRRSTELNFSHKPRTVAKLYTAFVRAMTRVARHFGGHVRGIIGDRVMVIFDSVDCYTSAVKCAIAMNTVSRYIVNKHFTRNEVICGIGIDAGHMLATKTGVRRHGVEQANYRNLVWLGRPANIASKLTDLASKPAETVQEKVVSVAYEASALNQLQGLLGIAPPSTFGGIAPSNPFDFLTSPLNPLAAIPGGRDLAGAPRPWQWRDESLEGFLSNLEVKSFPTRLVHKDPNFASFFLTERTKVVRARTPVILMTARVWKGFRSANSEDAAVRNGWFKPVRVKTPGLAEVVIGAT